MTAQRAIEAVWMRGGTSKGVFFHARDLPADPREREALLLRVIGSPDPYGRQIDGLGGATSSTSKVAIIRPSERPDCDVEYLFGHVAIDRPLIDWSGNCGNLSAAVGPFAIEEGLVRADDRLTRVRVWQANTAKRYIVEVPTPAGEVAVEGDCRIAGVPGTGAPLRLRYLAPGGGSGLPLLPSGRARERLQPSVGEPIEASLVNAGNPTVFLAAADLGLRCDEPAAAIDGDGRLLARLEAIRVEGALRMGLDDDPERIRRDRPGTPKVCWLAPPRDYLTTEGETVRGEQVDLLARMLSLGRLHHAITGTGAIALAVAAAIEDSLPANLLGPGRGDALRIGHNAGIMPVWAEVQAHGGGWQAREVSLLRTARRLMEGRVRVPSAAPRF